MKTPGINSAQLDRIMKSGLFISFLLTIHATVFAQQSVPFVNLGEMSPIIQPGVINDGTLRFTPIVFGGSGSVSYFTGSGSFLPPVTINGSAAEVRQRSFSGSDYFMSSGSMADTAFALRLGNGVSPFAAGNAQVSAVPEPSTFAIAGVALLALLTSRSFATRRASR
jgi:hypothetical protein